jgi:hypothetical protein
LTSFLGVEEADSEKVQVLYPPAFCRLLSTSYVRFRAMDMIVEDDDTLMRRVMTMVVTSKKRRRRRRYWLVNLHLPRQRQRQRLIIYNSMRKRNGPQLLRTIDFSNGSGSSSQSFKLLRTLDYDHTDCMTT